MSTPAPERVIDPDAAKKAKLENANLRVGILVAVVTLLIAVAGFLGIKLNNTTDEKQAAQGAIQTLEIVVSTQGSALTENSAELDAAKSSVASLQAANNSLSSRLAASTPTVPTPEPGPAAAGANVRHTGTVVLPLNESGADLDTLAVDPTWGTLQSTGIDIQNFNGKIWPYSGKGLTLGTTLADYATCSTQTGYTTDTLDVEQVIYLCLFTGEGRFVAAQVTAVNEASVTLNVTSYNKP